MPFSASKGHDVVFNGVVASQVVIKEEFENWRSAKLFRGSAFDLLGAIAMAALSTSSEPLLWRRQQIDDRYSL
jgi:hypothetical protein